MKNEQDARIARTGKALIVVAHGKALILAWQAGDALSEVMWGQGASTDSFAPEDEGFDMGPAPSGDGVYVCDLGWVDDGPSDWGDGSREVLPSIATWRRVVISSPASQPPAPTDATIRVGADRSPCTLENCGHMRQLDAIVDLLGMPRGTRSVLDELRARNASKDEFVPKCATCGAVATHWEILNGKPACVHCWKRFVDLCTKERDHLRAELLTTKARLDGTTSAIPAIVNNHVKSHKADLTRFVAAYKQMRFRFSDKTGSVAEMFAECDRLVELHLADKPLSSEP